MIRLIGDDDRTKNTNVDSDVATYTPFSNALALRTDSRFWQLEALLCFRPRTTLSFGPKPTVHYEYCTYNIALQFDDHESGKIKIDNGIGQGDPLSMALYQYYNADLLDVPQAPNEDAAAYVDDAILVATAKSFEETHKILEDMMTRTGGAKEWAKEHNSKFELTKLALIDFAHRNKKVARLPLKIENTTVEPSSSTKYLGIYLDQHLNWKEQEANALKKDANWAAQIRRQVRPGWGLSPKHAKRLYTAVAIPRILYGIDVWAPPTERKGEDNQAAGNRHAVNRLASVQRPGALAIVGGLRTSPSDSLCAHANITPMNLEVEKHCGRAALRLATLPGQHPLTKLVRKCAKRKVKKHKSPLHSLANAYEMSPESHESIPVAIRNPSRIGKELFRIHIPSSKEESKREDAEAPEHVRIYTDGSAHDGTVGAAAIVTRDGKNIGKLRYHLGKDSEHTVFEAELVGILLGLQLIKDKTPKQPSIRDRSRQPSGHQIPHLEDGQAGTLYSSGDTRHGDKDQEITGQKVLTNY